MVRLDLDHAKGINVDHLGVEVTGVPCCRAIAVHVAVQQIAGPETLDETQVGPKATMAQIVAVVDVFNGTNRLADAYQVEPDVSPDPD